MENNRLKRNIMALVVAVPIIYFLSILTSVFDHKFNFRFWDGAFEKHHKHFKSGNGLVRAVDFSGEWQFALGDDAARSAIDMDDGDWEKIDVPSYWEGEGFKNHDGYAWYRRDFDMDEKYLESLLYVDLGYIDDADEVFINGQRVGGLGQFPPSYVGAYNQYRRYAIPNNVLKQKDNVIAVRVYDGQMGGGIYKGEPGIYATAYPAPLLNLEGDWKFRLDGKGEETFTIQVPGIWESQGYEGYDGLAWYSREFKKPELENDQPLVLVLGRIDDTDEVTINGEFVGRTGNLNASDRKIDPDYFRIERHYEFSPTLLKDHNVIEVKIHDSGGEGGIYSGPVSIMTKEAYLKYLTEKARG